MDQANRFADSDSVALLDAKGFFALIDDEIDSSYEFILEPLVMCCDEVP